MELATAAVQQHWLFGRDVSEATELLLVFGMFMSVLVGVYFLQRYIGDY